MHRLCLLVLLAVVALPALAAAPATAGPDLRFSVDITGAHVIEWEYRGENFPQTPATWCRAA